MSIAKRRHTPGLARLALVAGLVVLAAGCGTTPPTRQANLCEVFDQNPDWYDYASDSAEEWGTPVHIQMAFVRHESSYRAKAKPPIEWSCSFRWGERRRPWATPRRRIRCGASTRRSGAAGSGAVRT